MAILNSLYCASVVAALGVIYSPDFARWRFTKLAYVLVLCFVFFRFKGIQRVPVPFYVVGASLFVYAASTVYLEATILVCVSRWLLSLVSLFVVAEPMPFTEWVLSVHLLYVMVLELWPVILFMNYS